MQPYWILVTTQSNRERLAVQNIARQNYDYYFPLFREIVVRGGVKTEVARPLFPRYCFVRTKPQWASLTGTFGVSAVVMEGKNPRRVPDRVVELLRGREDEEGFVHLDEDDSDLRRGSSVKVGAGMFQGNIGIYQGMDEAERAIVLFRLLGKEHKVHVNPKVLITI